MKKKVLCSVILSFCGFFLNSTAQIIQKTYGGSSDDEGNFIQQTTDGGFILAGNTISFGDTTQDVYLIRTDSNGDTIWTKTFGVTRTDYGNAVRQTNDGGFIVAGSTDSLGSGHEDFYLLKADSNGNNLWTKIYKTNGSEQCTSMILTKDGGYCLAGYSGWNIGEWGEYLIKTDVNGDTSWTRKIRGAYSCWCNSIQQTLDGGYILGGDIYDTTINKAYCYLIKTNGNGDTLWTKTFNENEYSYANSVLQTSDSGYVIAGFIRGNYYLIKVDSSGNKQWSKEFDAGGDDRCFSVVQSTDNGYVLAGYSYIQNSATTADVLLLKTDENGNLLWSKKFGGTNWDQCSNIQLIAGGGYAMIGSTQSYGAGGNDVYLIKSDCVNFPTVNIFTNDSTDFCQGDTVSVLLQSNVSGGTNYQWMKDEVDITGATSSTYTATTGGTYKVIVSDANGCSNESNLITINVFPLPPQLTIIQQGDTLMVPYFFGSFQWYLNDTIISGATAPTYIITQSGRYKLEFSYGGNCKSFSNEYYAVYSGIEFINKASCLYISPNPLTSFSILQLNTKLIPNESGAEVVIYNVLGKEMMRRKMDGDRMEIERGSLVSGVYFVRVTDEERQWVEKMVVE